MDNVPGTGDEMPEVLAKQVLQDQTDLLGKAQGRVRILEGALVAKDAKHKDEVIALKKTILDLEAKLLLTAAEQGMVPNEVYMDLKTKHDRLEKKLEATKKYAEQMRILTTDPTIRQIIDAPKKVVDSGVKGVES